MTCNYRSFFVCSYGHTKLILHVHSQDIHTSVKVVNKSLIIHKSAYHLFSLLISKRGLSSLQTRKTFGKILSGNYRFLILVMKSDATQLHILITLSFTLLGNIIIVITNNRLVSLLPIGSNLVIMSEIVNIPATKLLILAAFKYVKSN